MKFSIAHATARPNGWQRTFGEVINKAVAAPKIEYVLSVDERFGRFDVGYSVWLKTLRLAPTERKCAVANWINAINNTTGDVVIVNSDDFSFPDNWDEKLKLAIGDRDPQTQPFVVHVSTGGERDDKLMTIQIASRALINHWGYLLWHEYDGLYVDDDFSEHAFADPAVEVIPARHLLFEHLHFSFGKSERDDVYNYENRAEGFAIGGRVLYQRRTTNFQ